MVQIICSFCGHTFQVYPCDIKRGRKYCSIGCAHKDISTVSPEVRFWKWVDKYGPVPPHRPELGACWIWTGSKSGSGGYGKLAGAPGQKDVKTHRFSWEIHYGQIPSDLWVLHKCDNRPCVNPAHLFLGNASDNSKDAASKGRTLQGVRHPDTPFNEADIIEIRRRYSLGVSQHQLARDHNVSNMAIWQIVKNRTWKHLLPKP